MKINYEFKDELSNVDDLCVFLYIFCCNGIYMCFINQIDAFSVYKLYWVLQCRINFC